MPLFGNIIPGVNYLSRYDFINSQYLELGTTEAGLHEYLIIEIVWIIIISSVRVQCIMKSKVIVVYSKYISIV